MKVENMRSANGNSVPNQFMITEVNEPNNFCTYFQSYDSTIVKECTHKDTGVIKTYLDRNKWDYSVTTGKYRNQFLGETKKETQKKIDSGEYKLADLN